MAVLGVSRTERDASRVIVARSGEVFGTVLQVPYGPLTPQIYNNWDAFITAFSPTKLPDPKYKDYYEAEILLRQTPIMACRPQGNAKFGGIKAYNGTTANQTKGLVTGLTDPKGYVFTDNDIQFLLVAADPSADNNKYAVKIVAATSSISNTFDIQLSYNGSLIQTFNVSLLRTQKDGFGNSVFIEEVIKNRTDVFPVVNYNSDLTILPSFDTTTVAFSGGVTITSFDTSSTNTAWDNFAQFNKYYTHYLVDMSCNAVIGKHVNDIALANWYQHAFIGSPSIKTNPNATETLNTWYSSVQTYRATTLTNLNTDHVTLTSNWERVNDNYNNTSLWVSPVGAAAARKAYTLNNISISQAACGANANRGVCSEAIELEQDVTTMVNLLDAIQVNCLTYSPAGVVVWGEKTLQTAYSNTSFTSHRTYFNYLEENIENNLFYYVFTDINDATRSEVRSLIEKFTNTQIGIHAENIQVRVPKDDALAAQRKMKVQVAVIPYPKANQIIFEFIHSRSGVDLNEVF